MTRPIYECRCDERLKTKSEKSTRLETVIFVSFVSLVLTFYFVYYESINRELKRRLI
jgi:hypothetical protein